MEIFNNLWMAISTPNETLMNIIAIPAVAIENFLILSLFTAILNIIPSWKQQHAYIAIMTLVAVLTLFIIPSPFNIFINYFIPIILAYIIFKNSLFKTAISILVSMILFNLVGLLILNPFLTIFDISAETLNTIPIYRLLYISVFYILTLFTVNILKLKNFQLSSLDDIDRKNKIIIIANIFFGIFAIIIQSLTLFYYVDKLPLLITSFAFVSLLVYFVISIYSLTKIFKLIYTTRKLESAESYNNTLRILHDNVRGFKHDFDNIVTTIGGYIKTNDMEGLKIYYDQLEDDCQRVNNLYLLNPDVVNNDGIYNLLTKKYYEAESKDIKVNITFLLDLSTLNMKIYEFGRILGILLDNAIEAASECDNKIINLTFRNDFKNSTQIIIVENTYKDKNLDMDKIFEKGVSGKENHTGLGLWEVRKLVRKNKNVNLISDAKNGLFKQQLEIYTK